MSKKDELTEQESRQAGPFAAMMPRTPQQRALWSFGFRVGTRMD